MTTELLPLLHYGLLSHSKALAEFVCESGYDLYQKNDLRFTEGIFKLLRKEFNHHPVLQCSQFLTDKGFAKRKIQFVVKALRLGISKHNELVKKKRMATQSKVAWTETNLAKKMEKVIRSQPSKTRPPSKGQPPSSAVTATAATNGARKGKSKKAKTVVAVNGHRNVHQHPQPQSQQQHRRDPLPNDSLSADEIRCNLPQPITMQPATATANELDADYGTDGTDGHEDSVVHRDEEEKAMEMGGDTDPGNTGNAVECGPNESIQIPQSTFEFSRPYF